MKLDKSIKITYPDGTQIMEGDKEITFGNVVVAGLTTEKAQDPRAPSNPMSGEEKMKRWLLAMKVEQGAPTFEVTVEEAAKIKDVISIFPIAYVGRCFQIIEEAAKAG